MKQNLERIISQILGFPQNHKLIRIKTKLNNKNENKTDEREKT